MPRPSHRDLEVAYAMQGSIRKTASYLGYDERTLRRWAQEDERIAAIFGVTYGKEPDEVQRLALASKDAELRTLRRDIRELSEKLGKREEWKDEIIEAARLPVRVPSFPSPLRHQKGLPERTIVLPVFDIQYGQQVVPTDVPFGKGAFDEEVFDARLASYIDRVTRLLTDKAQTANFTELHVCLGGDMVEGEGIFRGQAWQLQKDPVQQVLELRVKLATAIQHIIYVCKGLGVEKVALYCIPGNHGKVGGKASGATPATYSWDYLVSELIIDLLRADPVDLKVNEPGGALMFETLGHTFLVMHGEQVKGWGGIPFYGFQRLDARAIRLTEVVFDYGLTGHIHQAATLPNGSGGEWIVSGDWVGGNNLSKDMVAASRPQQKLLIVGAKQGVCTDERLYFDDRTQRHRPVIHNVREAA